ncbi:MAG: hypothetical protein HY922_09665 [Elusimicrobia bacterium]|nr:hypothetical protein [Elusimicrobiota bacterium]
MDFERVLKLLLDECASHAVRYGVIGGFALGALGAARATMDVDLLVHQEDLAKLDEALAGAGYARFHHTENFSQYRHPDAGWGRIDILRAFRPISLAMIGRAKEMPIFRGAMSIRVLEPEDVIGLKVQALANDPRRFNEEIADIEALMRVYGSRLDFKRLEEYFGLFNFRPLLASLRERTSC